MTTADGWYGFRLIQADQARDTPGLDELAAYVERGMIPRAAPYLVARRRMDAPYPDAVVAVPLPAEVVRDWWAGDRSAAREVAQSLEHALATLLDRERGRDR